MADAVINVCGCGFVKNGDMFICPKHYELLKQDSDLKWGK